jgi:hypothetical protein
MRLLLLLVGAALSAGQVLRGWCDGRVICSDEAAESRACVLVEATLELADNGVFLNNSHPAGGTLSMDGCDDQQFPEQPLLSNAFGLMARSKVFGELDVGVNNAAKCQGRGEWNRCQSAGKTVSAKLACVLEHSPTVYVMLNRDMTGNIFHILFNSLLPLFRMRQQLGIDLTNNRTRVLLIDPMAVSAVEVELLEAALGGSRVDAMAPDAAVCFGALVIGGES